MQTSTTNVNSVLAQIGNALQAAKRAGFVAGHFFDDQGIVCHCDTISRAINLESESAVSDLKALLRDIYAITPATQAMVEVA